MVKRRTKEVIKPKLYKTIFQARFGPHLKFYELLYPAARKLSNYPHWRTDRLSVNLFDYEKRCSLVIEHSSFGYNQDGDLGDIEIDNIQKALTELPKNLEITSFVRLGFRRYYLLAVRMSFEELVKILDLKLFSQDKDLINILPPSIDDIMYVVDSSDGHLRYHIRIGPVKKEEIPKHIDFDEEIHLDPKTRQRDYSEIINKYPNVAIFIDVDVFWSEEKIPTTKASSFVTEARGKIDTMIQKFQGYFLGS